MHTSLLTTCVHDMLQRGIPRVRSARARAAHHALTPAHRALFTWKAGGTAGGLPPSADELFARVRTVHESVLRPLNDKFLGPLEKASDDMVPLPLVFVLGNHSSGKSSFINYVVGRQVQSTGAFQSLLPAAAIHRSLTQGCPYGCVCDPCRRSTHG